MRILGRVLLAILLLLLLVGGLIAWYTAHPNLPEYTPPQKMIHLEEQWSKQDRETYYYTPQGTQVKGLRYDWFTHLEQPFNKDKFASPENLARFGFLIEPEQIGRAPDDTLAATAKNPGNLPVGFARHQDGETGAWYLDITCSACHTGELRYKGTAIRIDGGAVLRTGILGHLVHGGFDFDFAGFHRFGTGLKSSVLFPQFFKLGFQSCDFLPKNKLFQCHFCNTSFFFKRHFSTERFLIWL